MADVFASMCYAANNRGHRTIVISNNLLIDIKSKNKFPGNTTYYSTMATDIGNYSCVLPSPFSWRLAYPTVDRKIIWGNLSMPYNEAVNHIQRLYNVISYIIAHEAPDVVVYEPPSNLFSQVAYDICIKTNTQYLGLMASRIPGRVDIYDQKYSTRLLKSSCKVNEERKAEIEDLIDGLVHHNLLPSYVCAGKDENLLYYYLRRARDDVIPRIKWCLLPRGKRLMDYETRYLFLNFAKNIRRKCRQYSPLYVDTLASLPIEGNYYVLPLHVQPEASTSAQAAYYCDMATFIKNCAISIPFPSKLVVKEHPAYAKLREKDFLKTIGRLPNVILLSSSVNNFDLIQKSSGVVTLTSTVGLEALLQNRLVYVFGDVFYDVHPGVYKVNSWNDFEKALRLPLKLTNSQWRESNMLFMNSYLDCSYPGTFVYTNKQSSSEGNAILLLDAICEHLTRFKDGSLPFNAKR